MKKQILLLTFGLISIYSFSQDFSSLKDYKFTDKSDYKKSENQVLECSNYLFKTPFQKNDLNRLYAIQYIMKWMEGTPDYTFSIDDKAMEITKGNNDLLPLYLGAMTKAVLESKSKLSDIQIYEKASDYIMQYCSNKNNNMKPTKAIKKMIKTVVKHHITIN